MSEEVERIRKWAGELGFADCRIAAAREAAHANRFREWLAEGCHGDMAWMEKTPERRCDPRNVLPDCKAVICLAMNYFPGNSPFPAEEKRGYRVARYAWNDDYHDMMEKRLKELESRLSTLGGNHRRYVDTGPVLERDFASEAGLGWNGKSTVQIHRKMGAWFFLAEILTTLDLPPDAPGRDHCGTCMRCIAACPTKAITGPREMDARRCISYLTIENKGPIPEAFREAIGDRIYGCDECLEVCPWNKFAEVSREATFLARERVFQMRLRDFLALNDEGFRTLFAKSPIKRIKRSRFLRNVCVALGNTGNADDMPALERAAEENDELIREHALWALEKLKTRNHETSRPNGGTIFDFSMGESGCRTRNRHV